MGLLWYWPNEWQERGIRRALIYAGGRAERGPNTKILWAFLSRKAKRLYEGGRLVVTAQRLDAPGKTWQQFVPIGYSGQNGAPSYASIIVLPTAGCWRVNLAAGGLHASVVFRALTG